MPKYTYKIAVLLRTNPNMSIRPFAELAQLLHFWMRMLDVVLDRQPGRIIHSHVAT
jgi:hypothetical protein